MELFIAIAIGFAGIAIGIGVESGLHAIAKAIDGAAAKLRESERAKDFIRRT